MITFKETIMINETSFTNKKGKIFLSPEIPLAHSINITDQIQQLSLPVLNELHLKNLYHIKTLNDKITTHTTVYNFLFLAAFFSIVALLLYVVIKQRCRPGEEKIRDIIKKLQEKLQRAEDDSLFRGGVVNTADIPATSHDTC